MSEKEGFYRAGVFMPYDQVDDAGLTEEAEMSAIKGWWQGRFGQTDSSQAGGRLTFGTPSKSKFPHHKVSGVPIR